MPAHRKARDLLNDIVVWGESIARHIDGMEWNSFEADNKTQHAVMKCIEVIGEASGRLMKLEADYAARFPTLELRKAYAARNKLSHGYFETKVEIIWLTAVEAVPLVVTAARSALASLESQDEDD